MSTITAGNADLSQCRKSPCVQTKCSRGVVGCTVPHKVKLKPGDKFTVAIPPPAA